MANHEISWFWSISRFHVMSWNHDIVISRFWWIVMMSWNHDVMLMSWCWNVDVMILEMMSILAILVISGFFTFFQYCAFYWFLPFKIPTFCLCKGFSEGTQFWTLFSGRRAAGVLGCFGAFGGHFWWLKKWAIFWNTWHMAKYLKVPARKWPPFWHCFLVFFTVLEMMSILVISCFSTLFWSHLIDIAGYE